MDRLPVMSPAVVTAGTGQRSSSSSTDSGAMGTLMQKQQQLTAEWTEQINELRAALEERQLRIAALEAHLKQREVDFTYNYTLIEGRDSQIVELRRQLDAATQQRAAVQQQLAETKQKCVLSDARCSDLKAQLQDNHVIFTERMAKANEALRLAQDSAAADLATARDSFEREKSDLQRSYMQRLKEAENSRVQAAEQAQRLQAEREQQWLKTRTDLEQQVTAQLDVIRELRESHSTIQEQVGHLESEVARHEQGAKNTAVILAERETALAEMRKALEVQRKEAEANHSAAIAVGEQTLREEAARAQKLEFDLAHAQSEYSALEARCAALLQQREEEKRRFEGVCSEIRKRSEEIVSKKDDEIKRVAAQLRAATTQLEDMKQRLEALETVELRQAQRERDDAQAQLGEANSRLEQLQKEIEKHKTTFSQQLAGFETATTDAIRKASSLQRIRLELEQRVHDLEALVDRHTRERAVERQQYEEDMSKSRRALRASEEARSAAEAAPSQPTAVSASTEQLTSEKRALEERLRNATAENERIRQQVAAVTDEIRNDPLILQGQQMQRRNAELEEELAALRTRVASLEASKKSQAEELQRTHQELRRLQPDQDALRRLMEEREYLKEQVEDAKRVARSYESGEKEDIVYELSQLRKKASYVEQQWKTAVRDRDVNKQQVEVLSADVCRLTKQCEDVTRLNNLLKAEMRRLLDSESVAAPALAEADNALERVVKEQQKKLTDMQESIHSMHNEYAVAQEEIARLKTTTQRTVVGVPRPRQTANKGPPSGVPARTANIPVRNYALDLQPATVPPDAPIAHVHSYKRDAALAAP